MTEKTLQGSDLFALLEKEHQNLIKKIDALDQKIEEVLKDWSTLGSQEDSALPASSSLEDSSVQSNQTV